MLPKSELEQTFTFNKWPDQTKDLWENRKYISRHIPVLNAVVSQTIAMNLANISIRPTDSPLMLPRLTSDLLLAITGIPSGFKSPPTGTMTGS